MKIFPPAVPAVVALVGLCWLGARQREVDELRREVREPVERRGGMAERFGREMAQGRRTVESERARVRRLAKRLESWSGCGWLQTDWEEVDEVEGMSREELIAVLEATEGGGEENNWTLRTRVLELLEKIDPEFVTRRTGQATALAEWARVDPAGAVAWFEEQVAAGNFLSKRAGGGSGAQFDLRKSLVWGLGASDPAAARRLIEALPEESRAAIFVKEYSPVGWSMKAKTLPAMAELMRAYVPEEKWEQMVASPFWEVGDFGEGGVIKNWGEMDKYFADTKATRKERSAVVRAVVQNARFPRAAGSYFHTIPEDIDGLRAWVARVDPALVTEATAAALGRQLSSAEEGTFPWVDYALRLHAAGEGDEVLVAVLEAYGDSQHLEVLRRAAERLSEGEVRERFLRQFSRPEP